MRNRTRSENILYDTLSDYSPIKISNIEEEMKLELIMEYFHKYSLEQWEDAIRNINR